MFINNSLYLIIIKDFFFVILLCKFWFWTTHIDLFLLLNRLRATFIFLFWLLVRLILNFLIEWIIRHCFNIFSQIWFRFKSKPRVNSLLCHCFSLFWWQLHLELLLCFLLILNLIVLFLKLLLCLIGQNVHKTILLRNFLLIAIVLIILTKPKESFLTLASTKCRWHG